MLEYFDWALGVLSLICSFSGLGAVFFLGRSRVKKIDKFVYGFEIPNDNIFFQLQRIPSYGGAFVWQWGAKRSGLEKIRFQFDQQFKRPFILTFWLFVLGLGFMVSAVLIGKIFSTV